MDACIRQTFDHSSCIRLLQVLSKNDIFSFTIVQLHMSLGPLMQVGAKSLQMYRAKPELILAQLHYERVQPTQHLQTQITHANL